MLNRFALYHVLIKSKRNTIFTSTVQIYINFANDKLADSYTSYKSDKQCRDFIDYTAAAIVEKIIKSWMMTALFQYSLMFVPIKQMLSSR